MSRTGAYVLVGPDPDGRRAQRIYVGEADNIRVRLDAHQKEKDFWTHGYVLTTKDNSLNKAHVRYLEARLLELAEQADNAFLDNGTAPVPVRLSEPEIAEMETYLDNVLPLFVLVGINVFEPAEALAATEPATESQSEPVADERAARLYLNTQLTKAEGEDRSRGFLVFEGAVGRMEKKVMMPSYEQLRDRLVQEGILLENGEHVTLTKSHLFDSPSAAASVLSGGNKNGRIEWRDAAGRTLKDLQAQTAGSEADDREQET
ncbi:MAG TPA: GIY-YIG nuclease family protein [Solirubrobacteraceae bacterium]|nr:GIY-YIG nuclease family protein [Solirubrobacteraceae bacterium]